MLFSFAFISFTFFSMSFYLPFTLHSCFLILHSFPFIFLSFCIHFLSCYVHFLSFCIHFLRHFFHFACISMQHVAWNFWQHILARHSKFVTFLQCLQDSGFFCRLRARLLNSNLLELQWTLAAKSENRMLRMIFQHVILSFSPAANIYNFTAGLKLRNFHVSSMFLSFCIHSHLILHSFPFIVLSFCAHSLPISLPFAFISFHIPFAFLFMSFHIPFTLHSFPVILHSLCIQFLSCSIHFAIISAHFVFTSCDFPVILHSILSCCSHFLSCCVHLLSCCIHFLSHFFHFCVYVHSTCCLKLSTTHYGDEQQHTRGRHCKCVKSWDSNCVGLGVLKHLAGRLRSSNLFQFQWTLAAKSENWIFNIFEFCCAVREIFLRLRTKFQTCILSSSPVV